jgi:hypothetical protein
MHGERDLVHLRTLCAGDLAGVLLAAALLQAGERAVLAGGVDERGPAGVDLRVAAAEVELGGLLSALRALEVCLHREEVCGGHRRGPAAHVARTVDALGGGLELLGPAAAMGDAGGELLGALLLRALAKRPDALETKLEGTGAHGAVIGSGGVI